MSVRLHFVVEGQSEEAFVNQILKPHLAGFQVWADARCVYTSRSGTYWKRGGMTSYFRACNDLLRWMKQDQRLDSRFTTMFDLYRLPDDFPGQKQDLPRDCYLRVQMLEEAFQRDLREKLDSARFIPYIQLHEFEALLLSDPQKLEVMYPNRQQAITALSKLCQQHQSPEEIDLESPPSILIQREIPDYDKRAAAAQVAKATGLQAMRKCCRHLDEWIAKLEGLGNPS